MTCEPTRPPVAADDGRTDHPLKILFITIADMPEGGGNTSRLKSLVHTLVSSGHRVSILNEHAIGISPVSVQQKSGKLCGAEYEYVLGSVDRKYGFRVCRDKFAALSAIWKRIKSSSRQDRIDVIWFNNLSFYDTYPLTLLAKRLGIATIQAYEDERHELVSEDRLSWSRRLFGINSYLADRWCPSMADGIAAISYYLADKYGNLVKDSSKIHLVPTIVDCAAWKCGPEIINEIPTVLYSGCFGEQDEIENVLAALAMLRNQGLKYRFRVIGGNARLSERETRIQAQIDTLGLGPVVERRGFVTLQQVRAELNQANVLLSIRRDGTWSRAGLSTKLSEYLASGRLVITSSVGDVPRYLRDRESALIVAPTCPPGQIAAALHHALSNSRLRTRIGAKGRQVALQYFDVPVAEQRLRCLLRSALGYSAARPGNC